MQILAANHVENNTGQAKSPPDWVVLGWRKWRFQSWLESVYPLAVSGYSFERSGRYLIATYTDAQEGRA